MSREKGILGYEKFQTFSIGDLVEWYELGLGSTRRGIIRELFIKSDNKRRTAMVEVVASNEGKMEIKRIMAFLVNHVET